MDFKHILYQTLGVISNRYLNMNWVFKSFLEVTHSLLYETYSSDSGCDIS